LLTFACTKPQIMFKTGITTLFSALVMQTGVFAQIYVKNTGNIGIGTSSPDFKLQVAGATEIGDQGAHDPSEYGVLQITRPSNAGNNFFNLSFVRSGTNIAGMGFASNSNLVGIWNAAANGTQDVPAIGCLPGNLVGINTANPDFTLQVAGNTEIADGGAHDPLKYGVLQLTRPSNQGTGYHLSFVRSGSAVSGMGYAPNSNMFGIWVNAGGSGDAPSLGFNGGKIGINNGTPQRTLDVTGDVLAYEYYATNGAHWPDYVFDSTYNLPVLGEVAAYIKRNHHLPDVPSAEDVKKDGISLGANQAILLKKVEELTLYTIDLNEKLQQLLEENKKQQAEIDSLKKKKGRR